MSVSVVTGGQFGSEGKGKTTSLLAREYGDKSAVVRCGGPNSGHITYENGKEYCLRLVPSGVVYARKLFLSPAAVIDLDILRSEIDTYSISPDELSVDPFSVVITADMRFAEAKLTKTISSTGSGTGAATAAKTIRNPRVLLIKDVMRQHSWLRPYVRDVRSQLHDLIDDGFRIILEGTQGFGLSLHHSRMFPKTTSKDTTAAQFVMEAGLSPMQVDEIVMVVRTYPIRVSGKEAGPMKNETSWETVRKESGYPYYISELSTVTKKIRRVARFDMDGVLDACRVNRPTALVVHGLDYLGFCNLNVTRFENLNERAKEFIANLESATGVPVIYAFTGKENKASIKLSGLDCVKSYTDNKFLSNSAKLVERQYPDGDSV